MKKFSILLFGFIFIAMLGASEEINLLKTPLKITNPATTVFRDGVYTIEHSDETASSELSQTVELNQSEVQSITFSIESRSESYEGAVSGNYGLRLNLLHADGSRTNGVSVRCDIDASGWKKASRTYQPKSPVKSVTYHARFRHSPGKVHFRNPVLLQGPSGQASPRKDFEKLKIDNRDLCIDTILVAGGTPTAAIVMPDSEAYLAEAAKINTAIRAKTGVELPVVSDQALRDARSLDRHYLVIGNRDRNETAANLYNLHYTLQDAKYPGSGGSELRSLHNPFGDRHNIILVGGSDSAGDHAAVTKLVRVIEAQPAGLELRLGFLADVTLNPDYRIARDVKDIPLWEESMGNGNRGYFGWNSLSMNLAMLYVTNDKYYADEFLRLAFPKDQETVNELVKRDGESYKDDPWHPLISVYHYRGAMVPLYWDLVEENPVWSDADRRRVTDALYRQLLYALTRNNAANLYKSYDHSGDYPLGRHSGWEAVTAYIGARYLEKYHPCPESGEALRLVANAMDGRFRKVMPGTIARLWYQTQLEPFFFYAALEGGLRRIGDPVLRQYAQGYLTLPDNSGKPDASDTTDRNMVYSSPFMMYQFGYLTQDDAFTELARQLPVTLGYCRKKRKKLHYGHKQST